MHVGLVATECGLFPFGFETIVTTEGEMDNALFLEGAGPTVIF